MTDFSPDQKRTLWTSTRAVLVAAWTWSPALSPTTLTYVKWSAIGAFVIDLGLLVALHYHWIGGVWHIVRQWEDYGALFLTMLWVSQVVRRRRMARDGLRSHGPRSPG